MFYPESAREYRNAYEQIAVWGRIRYTVIGSLDEIARRCGYADWNAVEEQTDCECVQDLVEKYLEQPDFFLSNDEFVVEELNAELY